MQPMLHYYYAIIVNNMGYDMTLDLMNNPDSYEKNCVIENFRSK